MKQLYLFLDDKEEVQAKWQVAPTPKLKEGEVLIKVAYSSLNYKDMLAFDVKSHVIPHYPCVPGIDVAGMVVQTRAEEIAIGTKVFATGYDLGIQRPGGFATYVAVPATYVYRVPKNLSFAEVMAYGTAGLTAGLSIVALQESLQQSKEQAILVTGANGGVGSIILSILQRLGYHNVTALLHQPGAESFVTSLGAKHCLYWQDFANQKALQKQEYALVFDTVGGEVLASALPKVNYQGQVSTCGNAGGITLNTTMFPFILRGVQLRGIDSVFVAAEQRALIWQHLFTDWYNEAVYQKSTTISITEVPKWAKHWRQHARHGRVLVKL